LFNISTWQQVLAVVLTQHLSYLQLNKYHSIYTDFLQDEILTICVSAAGPLHYKASKSNALRVTVEHHVKQCYFIKLYSKMPVGANYV